MMSSSSQFRSSIWLSCSFKGHVLRALIATTLMVIVWWKQHEVDHQTQRYVNAFHVAQFRATGSSADVGLSLLGCAEINTTQSISPIPCTTVEISKMKFPMCSYTSNDYISSIILTGNVFEAGDVMRHIALTRTLNMVKSSLVFVDIGANLGSYSLPVLHAGGVVVAVEASLQTAVRLVKSACLGGVASRLTLLHNGVSNSRSTFNLNGDPSGFQLTGATGCTSEECRRNTVQAVYLDDLLLVTKHDQVIIKVDTEGHEINVFDERTASEFFSKKNVLLVQLEFGFFTKDVYTKQVNNSERIERFLDFFYGRNYFALTLACGPLERNSWRQWPGNILMTKSKEIARC